MTYDVTIGIPTYNRANCLARAVDSALAQQGVSVEIVVSDNNSADDTSTVMQKYAGMPNVRYLKNSFNIGPSANYNQCLDKASGQHFMILGDDDWLSSDYCKAMLHALETEDAVFLGQCQTVAPDGTFISRSSDMPFRMTGVDFVQDLLLGKPNVRRHACFMFAARTKSIRDAGGFPNTEAGQHCDNMVLFRLLLTRALRYDPIPVNFYSVYPESYGNSNIPSVAIASLQYLDYWDRYIGPALESTRLRNDLVYSLSITYIKRVLKYGKGWKEKLKLILEFPRWGWLVSGLFRLTYTKMSPPSVTAMTSFQSRPPSLGATPLPTWSSGHGFGRPLRPVTADSFWRRAGPA